ncbi:MAG: LysR family transcriptional regulator [Pseudomonadota bacterium]
MTKSKQEAYRIPSVSALIAFESAARHLNFSLAAEELNTSQSAISRHIQGLESRFGRRLFDRSKRKHNRLQLTPAGTEYYRAVVASLDGLHNATRALGEADYNNQLMISCTHETSHLFLMPRFDALQQHLGNDIQIKIITSEYQAMETSPDPRIDVMLKSTSKHETRDGQQLIFREAIQPICSPGFFEKHAETLKKPISEWQSLTFLNLSVSDSSARWSDWEDLFSHYQVDDFGPKYLSYFNYVYLLEAVAAGRGVGLGWRHLIERHLDDGMFVTLTDEYIGFNNGMFGLLTEKGRELPQAQQCLTFLRDSVLEASL